jgi:hypothetical protein
MEFSAKCHKFTGIVILSERSESKDLRINDTAKILRLPLVAQDDKDLTFCVSTLDFRRIPNIFCAGGSRPSPTFSYSMKKGTAEAVPFIYA